jgi:hypothetical protein
MFLLQFTQLALLLPQFVSDFIVPVFLMVESSLGILKLKADSLKMLPRLLIISLYLLFGGLLLMD